MTDFEPIHHASDMMNILVCTRCGGSFSDTMFHITTSAGHIYCEQCIFEAMSKRRE